MVIPWAEGIHCVTPHPHPRTAGPNQTFRFPLPLRSQSLFLKNPFNFQISVSAQVPCGAQAGRPAFDVQVGQGSQPGAPPAFLSIFALFQWQDHLVVGRQNKGWHIHGFRPLSEM